MDSKMFKTTHLSHNAEELSGDEAAEKTEAEDGIRGKMPEMNPSPASSAQLPSLNYSSLAAADHIPSPPIQRSKEAGRPLNEVLVMITASELFLNRQEKTKSKPSYYNIHMIGAKK